MNFSGCQDRNCKRTEPIKFLKPPTQRHKAHNQNKTSPYGLFFIRLLRCYNEHQEQYDYIVTP